MKLRHWKFVYAHAVMNDTKKRRRFVWDEMAFLQLWWDQQATAAQKAGFKQVSDERLYKSWNNLVYGQ